VTDVNPLYDLRKLLTPDFENKKVWRDLAEATSVVLYENVDQHRRALALGREPLALVREYRILMAKQLGLDYRSIALTDADYDRLINFISLYNPEKGTKEFIKFLGFIKNADIELIPLWTNDYKTFVLNNFPNNNIFTKPTPGEYYPTTHVGIAYDGDKFAGMDEEDTIALFYELAPIHLVLKWIAALFRFPEVVLYVSAAMISTTQNHFVAFVEYIANLWLAAAAVMTVHEQFIVDPSLYVPMYMDFLAHETAQDIINVFPNFSYNNQHTALPTLWSFTRNSEAEFRTVEGDSHVVEANQPRIGDYNPANSTLLGWLFEPKRVNYLRYNKSFAAGNWGLSNATYTANYGSAPDNTNTHLVADANTSQAGYIRQVLNIQNTGNHTIWARLRENTSRYACVFLRQPGITPSETGIVVDLNTGNFVAYNPSAQITCGVIKDDAGFWNAWFVVNCTVTTVEYRIYPAWATTLQAAPQNIATGRVEYWCGQVEEGNYPSSLINTTATFATREQDIAFPGATALKYFNNPNTTIFVDYYPHFRTTDNQCLLNCYIPFGPNYIRLMVNPAGYPLLQFRKDSFTLDMLGTTPIALKAVNKMAFTWSGVPTGLSAKLFLNGANISTANFILLPGNLTKTEIGGIISGVPKPLFGHISRIVGLIGTLSDTDLQNLTAA
jgi:hypothetical protein